MNEKPIEKVLEIEKKAQAIYDSAVREAEKIPVQAEQEAQALVEKARAEAMEEANQITATIKAESEIADLKSEAEEKIKHTEKLAKSNFDRAVSYVLARIVGGE